MKIITKMMIAFCIGLLSVLGMYGGIYLHLYDTDNTAIQLCALYMFTQGLVTAIVCIVYNFVHAWDDDKPKSDISLKRSNLDKLEEVPVEEVN